MAQSVNQLKAFGTFGPFLEFSIDGKGLGETVTVQGGKPIALSIRVQSPTWFDVDRIEIYRNGELLREIVGRADCVSDALDCLVSPNRGTLNYQALIGDTPSRDAWYVIVAMGLRGKSLAPVYSSNSVARLGIFELIQRLTPLLPPLRSLATPLTPSIGSVRPYAVTNPIFVDADGDGIVSSVSPAPSWAARSTSLSEAHQIETSRAGHSHDHAHDHHQVGLAHDHRVGLGRLRHDAAAFKEYLERVGKSRPKLRSALRSLRIP